MKFCLPFSRSYLPTPAFLEDREYFLPIRVDVLLERMLRDERLDESDRESFRILRQLLGDRFHYEYHATLESLKSDFVPFDPDCETLAEPDYPPDELHVIRTRLYASLRQVLQIGNYRELTPEQLAECLEMQPIGGLSVRVDTGDFDEFHVYYRGVRHREGTERILFFWRRTFPLVCLNRVFVIAQFKPENGGQVLIKMFKDVPVENIKIIAPKVKLGMPVFARIKIGGSVAGSLVAPVSKLLFAFALSWVSFFVILGGFLIAAFKGLVSFMNSRTKYMQVFSSSLYYKNLSNNNAALTTLLDAAEVQELKETLLGYFILYVYRDRAMTMQELGGAAEAWVEQQFGHHFDFEVDDAVRKLIEKRIAQVVESPSESPAASSPERYRAEGLAEALRRLDEDWDAFNTFLDAV